MTEEIRRELFATKSRDEDKPSMAEHDVDMTD